MMGDCRTFHSPTDSCRNPRNPGIPAEFRRNLAGIQEFRRNSGGIRQESRNSAGMTRFRGFREDSGRNPAGIRVTFLIWGDLYIYIHILLIPSKFNIMNIIKYLIHLKYTVFYIILGPYLQKWRGWLEI